MLAFSLAVGAALVFSFLCSVSEAVLLSVRHAHIQRLGDSLRQSGDVSALVRHNLLHLVTGFAEHRRHRIASARSAQQQDPPRCRVRLFVGRRDRLGEAFLV